MSGPEYEKVINIHGYNRIHQYYLQPGDYKADNEAELMNENKKFCNGEEDDDVFWE